MRADCWRACPRAGRGRAEVAEIAPAPWWRPEPIQALLNDLITAELARLHHPAAGAPALSQGSETSGADATTKRPIQRLSERASAPLVFESILSAETPIGADGLALSSLEFIDLATAVSVQFGLSRLGLDRRLMRHRTLGDWVETVRLARAKDDSQLRFQTSGSTGQPKTCPHTMAALREEAAHWAGLFADRRRVLRAVPCHHIFGFLFTLMLPAMLDVPVLDLRDGLPAGALARAEPGDLLIAHPGFFALATAEAVTAAPDLVAVTSTGPCPDAVWQALADAGVARTVEVYGASELGGIGLRQAATEAFTLLPFWDIDPHDGLIRRLPDGGRRPSAALDRLLWCGERRFRLGGRIDGVVQVGGINVFPQRVRKLLLEHPAVAAAEVRISDHAAGGRLEAVVVPTRHDVPPTALAAELQEWLAARVTAAEQPRPLRVVDLGSVQKQVAQTPAR